MKLLSSLKRTCLIKKANDNFAFNRTINANSIKKNINQLNKSNFLYSTLEKQHELRNYNQSLFTCTEKTIKPNSLFQNNNINNKNNLIKNDNNPLITLIHKKYFSKLTTPKNNLFTSNKLINNPKYISKSNKYFFPSFFPSFFHKNFCDTISFGDDLNKLINKIERADMDRIPQKNIRNFCIIAHIDHGKSTLSDRLLEKSGAINKLEKKNSQILDTLKVERDRGITVKAQTATMIYKFKKNEHEKNLEEAEAEEEQEYILNLIDTPGHVDFSYEVARSLRPCQGAILLVDASKGVQAQTLSNFAQAKNLELTVLPVINKIDLPSAHVDSTLVQMEKTMGFNSEDVLLISAKNGINLDKVFEHIVKKIPPPAGDKNKPLRLLVF